MEIIPMPSKKPAKPQKPATKPGPAPELFKIDGETFASAVKKSLAKKKPAGGWPKA